MTVTVTVTAQPSGDSVTLTVTATSRQHWRNKERICGRQKNDFYAGFLDHESHANIGTMAGCEMQGYKLLLEIKNGKDKKILTE